MTAWGFVAAALVWGLGRALGLTPVAGIAGLALVGFAPGLALVRVAGFAGRSLAWKVTAAGVLSPPLLAGAGLLAGLAGVRPQLVTAPLLAVAVLALFLPVREKSPAGEATALERWLVVAGTALAGFVALALLHPRMPRWSDSWFHAAVFHEVERSGIHATFPHFADMPLPYPWFFHLYLVMASPIVHADPFVIMATVNQLTAFLLPVGFYTLARALGLPARASVWGAVVGVIGVNLPGPVNLLLRSAVGETAGWSELGRALSDADLTQGSLAMRFPGFQSSWLARLWTPSAFNFALAFAAFVLVLLLDYLRDRRGRTLALFALATALLLHWHTLTALHLSIGMAAGMAWAGLARLRADGWRALLPGAAVAAAMLVAYLVSRPYLMAVTLGGAAPVMRPRLIMDNVLGLLLSMGPVALAALASLPALGERERNWSLGTMAGLAVTMLVFDLPGQADEKLFWPLYVLVAALAAPAVAGLASGGRRGRAVLAGLLFLGAANFALTAFGFLRDSRSMRTMFDAPHAERAAFYTPDERAALDWIRARTPRDAVFLQPLRPAGTEPILVHGERRMWLGCAEAFYRASAFESTLGPPAPQPVWDELRSRDALQRRAFGTDTLAAVELDSLRARPWPLYVWWDSSLAGGMLSPTLADTVRVTRVAFDSPSVRVLELRR